MRQLYAASVGAWNDDEGAFHHNTLSFTAENAVEAYAIAIGQCLRLYPKPTFRSHSALASIVPEDIRQEGQVPS